MRVRRFSPDTWRKRPARSAIWETECSNTPRSVAPLSVTTSMVLPNGWICITSASVMSPGSTDSRIPPPFTIAADTWFKKRRMFRTRGCLLVVERRTPVERNEVIRGKLTGGDCAMQCAFSFSLVLASDTNIALIHSKKIITIAEQTFNLSELLFSPRRMDTECALGHRPAPSPAVACSGLASAIWHRPVRRRRASSQLMTVSSDGAARGQVRCELAARRAKEAGYDEVECLCVMSRFCPVRCVTTKGDVTPEVTWLMCLMCSLFRPAVSDHNRWSLHRDVSSVTSSLRQDASDLHW